MFSGMSFHCDFGTKINLSFDADDAVKKDSVINDLVGFPFHLEFKTKYGSMRFYLCKDQLERMTNLGLQALQEHDRVQIEREL